MRGDTRAWLALAAIAAPLLAGCPQRPSLPSAGRYDAVPPEGRVIFEIRPDGIFSIPREDIDCSTSLESTRLHLTCHGHAIIASWQPAPDGSVSTDVLD